MKATELRTLIKESIQEYIKEIDEAGDKAALLAKVEKTQEAIDKRKKLTSKDGLDEAYHEFLDERKMREMTSEIKLLEKSMAKYKKQLEKMNEKKAPKQMEDEGMMDEVIDEVNIDETFPESGAQLEEEELTPEESEELRKKAEYYHKEYGIAEAKKKMTAAQKEKKEDIVKSMKKSNSFGKSKDETAKMHATATKLAKDTKKESVETEGEVLNEQFLHMQKLAGLITETQYKQKMQMLSEEVIDFTNSDQYGDFLQNKTKELEGKKVKLNIFDTFANEDKEKQKFTGDIIVDLKKRTGGAGNLTFDAVLIDDGGYNYISPFKNKEIKITIPSVTGGKGGFDGPIGEGPRGLFKVKTLEIL